MSALTAEGRKRIRDMQRERMNQRLRKDPELGGIPAHRLDTLSELKLVGRTLYLDIKQRGAVLATGEVNPSVEAHRKNAHEQLCFLSAIAELKQAQASKPVDIFEWMNQADNAGESEQGSVTGATATTNAASDPATAEPAS
jgi:hypothetical protein